MVKGPKSRTIRGTAPKWPTSYRQPVWDGKIQYKLGSLPVQTEEMHLRACSIVRIMSPDREGPGEENLHETD